MAAGYTRQAAANIQAGLPIQSADMNAEFNQLQSTFDTTTGHDHSGSASGTGAKISLSSAVTNVLPLANGGSNAILTASNGGIVYSTGSALAVLAGTATANQLPVSGSSAAPSWANIASLLTAGSGIALSGTTNVTISLTSTTGSGASVLAASPSLTGQVNITQASSSSPALQVNMPTGVVNTEGAIRVTGNKASLEIMNAAVTQNWYLGLNDADANALYLGRGYGPNQGITPAIKITTGDIITLASALPIASGGTGATSAAAAFAAIAIASSSIISNVGHIKFQNGLILQWGTLLPAGGSTVSAAWSVVFPNGPFSVMGTSNDTTQKPIVTLSTASTTTVGFTLDKVSSGSIFYLAVGN